MSGREENPDPRPVEWPLNLKRPLSLQEEIKRFVRAELSQHARDEGFETFEESDDFDVGDDDELVSPYELTELQEERAFSPAEPPLTSEPDKRESAVPNETIPDKTSSVSSTPADGAEAPKSNPAQ